MAEPVRLFMAGMPVTGKTAFGNCLMSHHGFLHIDMENLTEGGFHYTWENY
jgi:adenylate kinase family enzyme